MLDSGQFVLHNYRHNLLASVIVPQLAIAFIGLESALGVALFLYEFPQWLVPGSIVLLLCFSALTIWSTSSGRTKDCGCYGGLFVITPQQSVLLNLGYILLLAVAWLKPLPNHQTATWQWMLALGVGVVASILAWHSKDKPLVDFSRLKIGNRWQRRWLKNSSHDLQQGSHFVVFLSQDCPYCKRWVPFLNMLNAQADLPDVLAIMSLTPEELETFRDEQRVRFPLVVMDKILFGYMVDAFPTAISIEDGVITEQWIGIIPEKFLDRIKQIYENLILKAQAKVAS